jgi:hypothetical protein
MKQLKSALRYLYQKPVQCTFLFSLLAGFIYALCFYFNLPWRGTSPLIVPIVGSLIGLFLITPFLLTVYNVIYLVVPRPQKEDRKAGLTTEITTILFGAFCSLFYAPTTKIQWDKDWTEQLYNGSLHTPLATWTLPTVVVVALVAVVGYLLLRLRPIHSLPPLLAVLAIGAMYLGAGLCVTWIIQILKHDLLLCLYPFNLILIAAKTVKEAICDYQPNPLPAEKAPWVLLLFRLCENAKNWPWLGILCALPLLGILIAALTLFGQAPDSIIQAWTQTSDWTFSQQAAPQNIHMDMHYLCTVSAGGHRKLVKPLRVGQRHGHRVLVNRQLCIANAFEQLLQERVPRFHRAVRGFYDRFGYPIARHIRSPYAADAIWLLMKPLEWCFLAVLYLFDTKPENRIAVQYPHAPPPQT